ncbi:hypothetical protein D3C71_1664740 [compost metagenome]
MTAAPFATGLASVSTTVLPTTLKPVTVVSAPFTWTVNAPASGGLSASSASP